MTNKIFLLFVIIIDFAFSQNLAEYIDKICKDIYNSGECARKVESIKIKQYPKDVKRKGDSLFVKINANHFHYVYANGMEDVAKVSFIEYFKRYGLYLIHVQFYEGDGYLLINDKNGMQVSIHNLPVFNNDGRILITTSLDLEAEYNPNAIQIWRVDNDNLILELDLPITDWGPSDPQWINSNKIIFKKNYLNINSEQVGYVQKDGYLVKVDNVWILE